MRGIRKTAQALLSASVLLFGATMSWSQSLIWLGNGHTWAYDVSANGSVVVGKFVVQGVWHAFRWEDGSLVDIGTLGGAWSYAYGVSADGSVVVGEAANSAGVPRAFRWTWQGMEDIGTLGGCCSWASNVSANGSVIVGYSRTATNAEVAFRWENGVMQALSGSSYSHAYGVSANGSVVVGNAYVDNHTQAVRWVNGTMEVLGLLPGGTWSEALGVSANGNVVVGYGSIGGGIHHAFRWTAGTGMVDLGTLPDGLSSVAYGVSADGSEVVGGAYVNWFYDWRAFRWRDGVMEDLNDTYADLLTDGSYLRLAYAISPDGRYIVGYGHHVGGAYGEAFLLDTGPRCTVHNGDVDSNGCVDDADLLAVLFAFGCSSGCGREDTNCDGTVDDADLLQVLFNFGSGC